MMRTRRYSPEDGNIQCYLMFHNKEIGEHKLRVCEAKVSRKISERKAKSEQSW
jgi:NADH:ubiquinone oxidoreductase subunit E